MGDQANMQGDPFDHHGFRSGSLSGSHPPGDPDPGPIRRAGFPTYDASSQILTPLPGLHLNTCVVLTVTEPLVTRDLGQQEPTGCIRSFWFPCFS